MSNNISCRNGIRLELSSTHNGRAHGLFSAITRSVYKRIPAKKREADVPTELHKSKYYLCNLHWLTSITSFEKCIFRVAN